MESLARITHETPERTKLRDLLVASMYEWKSRLVPIVREVTGSDDVDQFLKEKPSCSFEVVQRLTPIVEALNVIVKLLKELASGKTENDLQATHGDVFRESLLYGEIIEKNRAWQKEFFGHTYEMPPIPHVATPERIERWKELRFELRYLPPEKITEDKDLPGWKDKSFVKKSMVDLFQDYQRIQSIPKNQHNPHLEGLSPLDLPGRWVLIDTRPKPNPLAGNQEYEDDREIQQIIHGKRNNIHPKEFSKPEFWVGIKKLLQISNDSSATVRLPRVMEQIVLGQGPDWAGTGTWESSEEWLDSERRIICGYGNDQLPIQIAYNTNEFYLVGFRPMVVFSLDS